MSEENKKNKKVMLVLMILVILLLVFGAGVSIGLMISNQATDVTPAEVQEKKSTTKQNSISNTMKNNTIDNTTTKNEIANEIAQNEVSNTISHTTTVSSSYTDENGILTGTLDQTTATNIAREFVQAVKEDNKTIVNKYAKSFYTNFDKYDLKNLTVEYDSARKFTNQYEEYIFDCDYEINVPRKEVSLGSMFIVAIDENNKIIVTVGATAP